MLRQGIKLCFVCIPLHGFGHQWRNPMWDFVQLFLLRNQSPTATIVEINGIRIDFTIISIKVPSYDPSLTLRFRHSLEALTGSMTIALVFTALGIFCEGRLIPCRYDPEIFACMLSKVSLKEICSFDSFVFEYDVIEHLRLPSIWSILPRSFESVIPLKKSIDLWNPLILIMKSCTRNSFGE